MTALHIAGILALVIAAGLAPYLYRLWQAWRGAEDHEQRFYDEMEGL